MSITTKVLERTAAGPLQTSPPPEPTVRLRLLLIEDNPADALLAQSYIRGVIPDVEFDEAVRLADVTSERAMAASCAILDLSLPDASGLEALQSLRAMSEELPIIVLTGFDDLQLGLAAIGNGAEDYLVKNFVDGDGLQRAIRYAIERRRLSFALSSQTTVQTGARPATAAGTHQVAIRIDPETCVCVLQCQTCSWQVERTSESLASWGYLERAILPHVAFGGSVSPVSTSDDGVSPTLPMSASDGSPADAQPDDTLVLPSEDDVLLPPAIRGRSAPGTWLG
jgi:DNA-binding response OmpR family regulator